jgi:tRNA G18 (ribose-2'-O)-methylase SpoU
LPPADYHLPLVLILGHERQGVRQELLEAADVIIDIPILGLGNSHNVAISAGIVLYHILAKTDHI